jgi:hypothetical protein
MKWRIILLPLLLCGCNSVVFEKQDGGAIVRVKATRVFWATESYEAKLTKDGGSLKASKSTVDSVALGAVAEGVAKGLAAGVRP